MGRGETGTPEETQRQRQGLGGCSLDAVERKQGLLAASLEAKLLGSLCSEGKGSSGLLGAPRVDRPRTVAAPRPP